MSADLIRRLIEAGTPADLIAEVAMLAGEVGALERRRASDRERQANRRHVTSRDTTDVTDTAGATPFPAPAPSFPPDPQTNPTPTHTPEHTPRAREANPFPRPEWADPQHWKDFLANRKRRDMVNTATAHARFLGDIARLADDEWPPGKLLEHAAGKGWGSINKPDQENGNGRSHTLGRHQPAGEARILAAGRAFVSRGAGSAAQ